MDTLAKHNREKLIDLLAERLVFERAGVKLYDRVVEKLRADTSRLGILERIEQHRAEEKEHEEWLETQIRSLGGSAHEMTEHAMLVERESKGIEDVVMNDQSLPHLFHALLAAELVDNSGWDLLVQLAVEAGDGDALRQFQIRKSEEEDHLALMWRLVSQDTRRQVLGAPASQPAIV